jgi:hypothetical protein
MIFFVATAQKDFGIVLRVWERAINWVSLVGYYRFNVFLHFLFRVRYTLAVHFEDSTTVFIIH